MLENVDEKCEELENNLEQTKFLLNDIVKNIQKKFEQFSEKQYD